MLHHRKFSPESCINNFQPKYKLRRAMLITAPKNRLPIPKQVKDLDVDWVIGLVCLINDVQEARDSLKIITLSVEPQSNDEGVLSDAFKVFVHLERSSEVYSKQRPLVHNLFVKLIPEHLRKLVMKHKLFQREIVFYRDVIPCLQDFLLSKGKNLSNFPTFSTPKFIYGDVSDSGEGVLILEDVSTRSFKLFDTSLLMLDFNHLKVAIEGLAHFHAITIAHDWTDRLKLVEKFPIFSSSNLMWVQDDMSKFLQVIVNIAENFLKSVPGEEETARLLSQSMSDPLELLNSFLEERSVFQCLVHGDAWHNNFMFAQSRQGIKMTLVDWQVSYYGNASSDLCYLIYSSTTGLFRRKNLKKLLKFYFDTLMKSIESLGVPINAEGQLKFDFEQFLLEFKKSLKICIMFCANGDDLLSKSNIRKDTEQLVNNSSNPVQSRERKLSIASDQQVRDLDAKMNGVVGPKVVVDRLLARALRRRNFLDMCREWKSAH